MTLSTQPYKGARDFYPEDKRLQKYIFGVMRKTVEKYGYQEYDAPILEPTELYASKTSDEIVNEQTYTFTDRGGRSVTIRTEMTPTVARMVAAKRQELQYPVRWYSIPNLWRYERPQRGRMREFWQLNVDIFGVGGLAAEHEMIMLTDAIMRAFGAKPDMYTIRINSRQLIEHYLMRVLGLDDVQTITLVRLIDRMHKMEHSAFVAAVDGLFHPSQREAGASDKLLKFLRVKSVEELEHELQQLPQVAQVRQLMHLLGKSHITNAVFDPSLMRGFDYYTDIVFEVFDNNPENNRSMFGGGRYDGLVGLFGVEPVPTVGFGMGDVTLQNFLETHNLLPAIKSEVQAYVVLIGDVYENAQEAIAELRAGGLNVAVDMTGRKPDKQIKSADKQAIPYVIIIGDNEIADKLYVVKNLKSGEEERHSAARIVSLIKDFRNGTKQ